MFLQRVRTLYDQVGEIEILLPKLLLEYMKQK